MFEVYLPKKYAVGEYILFASSLLMTGAYRGIYKITLILPLKLSWLETIKAMPLTFWIYYCKEIERAFDPSSRFPDQIKILRKSGGFPT